MTCSICGKESATPAELCKNHEAARKNLAKAYEGWQIAYGTMEWMDFLQRVPGLEGCGQWAQEVAKYLVQKS